MQIEITTRNIERPELHRVAAARAVEQALERFAGGVSRVVVTIGNTSESVVAQAHCPVLTVKANAARAFAPAPRRALSSAQAVELGS